MYPKYGFLKGNFRERENVRLGAFLRSLPSVWKNAIVVIYFKGCQIELLFLNYFWKMRDYLQLYFWVPTTRLAKTCFSRTVTDHEKYIFVI